MTIEATSSAIRRTLAWYETLGYAPTRAELLMTADGPVQGGAFDPDAVERGGRVMRTESADRIVARLRDRDPFQPRKRRRACRVARWLARLSGVRFVALANTTALGCARDEGDLDFFVIVRAGTIWTTRLIGGLPFRLFGMTPRGHDDRDAVCLSYFVADDALDLSPHQLAGDPDTSVGTPTPHFPHRECRDDPYFRYWFLSLLPLFDDGVSDDLWAANEAIRRRHPRAEKWIAPPDVRVAPPRLRIPAFRWFEKIARATQMAWFPPAIRLRMNRDTTVIVDDRALKFHVTDGREEYRKKYYELCHSRGIEP